MRKFELILRRTRNIGQKKKRKITNAGKKGRMAAAFLGMVMTAAVLVSGMEMRVSAQTIRHTHSGDEQNGGECFSNPVYHTHVGSDTEEGECYSAPIYHVHEGDGAHGGACYGEKITHNHSGNAFSGGACYAALYHQHNDSCYAQGDHTSACPSHREYHSYDCGTVHDWDGDGHGCDGFTAYDCDGHVYLACGMSGGTIVGYAFSCSYWEGQVIGYRMNCGKTSETVEGYELTCTKTADDVDHYEKTCGMEEGQEIEIPDPPTEDNGNSGNEGGNGEGGNGEGESGEGESGGGTEPGETETEIPEPDEPSEPEPIPESATNLEPEQAQEPEQTPQPIVETVTVPSPSVAPTVKKEVTGEAPVRKKQTTDMDRVSPEPKPETDLNKQNQQNFPGNAVEEKVELPQAAAQPEDAGGEPLVLKRRWAVFTPVIKMLSITSGTVLSLAAIVLLLLYLRRSVRVYNDNGKGRMKYLGRAAVTLSEEGYYIRITEKLEERAATNRYCIRPDLFLIGKNSSWEIYVVRDGKKKSVYLDKEMTFTI